jgi:predicted transcriptional regulator
MRKPTKASKKLKVVIATDGERGFFERGKMVAKLADEGKSVPAKRVINFDNPEEMLAILTRARRNLMVLLRKGNASINDIARLLHRDKAVVAKDVQLLEHYGLVTVKEEINSGHRHRIIVHAITRQPIYLEATI